MCSYSKTMPMDRRQFVTIGGLLLGGCLADVPGGGDRSSGKSLRSLLIDSTGPDIDEYGIEFTVEVLDPNMGGDEPSRLEITVSNQFDETLALDGGNRKVFGETTSYEQDGLWLLKTGRTDTATKSADGCWMMNAPGITEEMVSTELDPGDTEAVESDVYGAPNVFGDDCPVTGTYHFAQSYALLLGSDPVEFRGAR